MSMATRGSLNVFEDPTALVTAAAQWLCERAAASHGRFAIALCGGSTPAPMYRLLAQSPIVERFPWERVHWFWGDERHVAPDDPDSNYHLAADALFNHAPVPRGNIHPVPIGNLTPGQSAAAYARMLQEWYGSEVLEPGRTLFDVNLLGIGDDGHTASLIPGQPVLDERTLWVAAVTQRRPQARITLTYPVLESSAATLFMATGGGKQAALAKARVGDTSIPAGLLRPQGEVLWFVDRAAAAKTAG